MQDLLRAEQARWCRIDEDLSHGYELLAAFIDNGGKRLRPAFAFWAFVGAGGDPADPRIVELSAALEMLHTFALVHDDVMDGSATRRQAPTVHASLRATHVERAWRGEPRRFGEGMAVLLGDLAMVYADRLAGHLPEQVRRGFSDLKIELHVGQYLDLWGTAAHHEHRPGRAHAVVRYKTAKYSVERPLQLGAALAGGAAVNGAVASRALSRFGLAVGEAFQLRDDLLGAFGDPVVTGKPSGDDLREAKATMLLEHASAWAASCPSRRTAAELLARLGFGALADEDVAAVQQVLVDSGARDAIEDRIAQLARAAEVELPRADLHPCATSALGELAVRAIWRQA